jgi:Cu-Zn family superoxide dismutase
MISKNRLIIFAAIIFSVGLASYAMAQERAEAELKNASGKTVGTAEFRQTKEGVVLALRLNSLPPGLHAVHIHSVGKCEAPAFTSAGGHFNPLSMKHGLKSAEGPHAGDLPDLYADKDGAARYEVVTQSITLSAGKLSVLDSDGKAIVIHATADDNMTDPSGNSGDRIACGVITKAPAKNK